MCERQALKALFTSTRDTNGHGHVRLLANQRLDQSGLWVQSACSSKLYVTLVSGEFRRHVTELVS